MKSTLTATMVLVLAWFFLGLSTAQGASYQDSSSRQSRRSAIPAQSPGTSSYYRDDPSMPWHLSADEVVFEDKEKVYIARGNVSITKPHRNLSADWVRFDQNSMTADARGNVVLVVGNDVYTGTRAQVDLAREIGTFYQGTVFLHQNHFHIKGDKIEKLGPETYKAEKATVTTCDGQRPDWKITGRKLDVTVEGYGSITHGTLWAGPIPVAYAPLFFFPAKTKRQSGLLPPQFGYSERTWESYAQPFFWAINDSSDATFYLHHMERRGTRPGVEYRWSLDEDSFGTLMADGFVDDKIDNGKGDATSLWGYSGDTTLRPNKDRWWLRMKSDHRFENDFNLALDIDLVSDQDYLHEFRSGYMGFGKTDTYFTDVFGRDLDPEDETARLNRLLVSRLWNAWSLNAETRWYDDVVNRRQNNINTQVQQLPRVQLTSTKQKISQGPFFFDLDSLYSYTYKEEQRRRHLTDVHPRIYYPARLEHYLSVEPSMGVRETVWYMDHDATTTAMNDRPVSRQIYDSRLDLSSQVYRVFDLDTDAYDRLKHALRPRIVHQYIPTHDENSYPDPVAESNLVTYSITNYFTLRGRSGPAPGTPTGEAVAHSYNQFARLQIAQSYDVNEAKEDNAANRVDQNRRTPFSAITADFTYAPSSHLVLRADAARSPYHDYYDYYDIAATVMDRRGDQVTVEHRYTYNFSQSLFTQLVVTLTDRLSVYVDYERNRYDDRDISRGLGFFYDTQCWALQAEYAEEENDRRYAFMIHLEGLGRMGKDVQARRIESPLTSDD